MQQKKAFAAAQVCVCVILLGVSGVAQLSGPDSEVNDDGEGDDVWVELLPVQLVDSHRAWFLQEHRRHMHVNGSKIPPVARSAPGA